MESNYILAKRPKDPNHIRSEETLQGHTEKVVESFQIIFGTLDKPTPFARRWLEFFKLDLNQYRAFHLNTLASCVLHDIGKANSGMKQALSKEGCYVIRHEHLSGLILMLPEVKESLSANKEIDFHIVLSSVIGHHLRASREEFGQLNPNNSEKNFKIYWNGVLDCFRLLTRLVGLPPIDIKVSPLWAEEERYGHYNYTHLTRELKNALSRWKNTTRKDQTLKRLLRAVRSALIVSDSAGSGLVRRGKELSQWLASCFSEQNLLSSLDIEEKVILPRIKQIEANNGTSFRWNDFQDLAETLPDRSLLLASCGTGKTLAAWRWIKGQLAKEKRSRVIFLYPTRATATEGFKDYVAWAPEADAALIHGSSEYELEGLLENLDDERQDKDFSTEEGLYALAYWQRRIFSATVDQFLAFLQNSYKSICLLPVLADSVIVIDEVHSFDYSLFSALKNLLKEFAIPVLCMTASLPVQRVSELQKCDVYVFPSQENLPDLQRVSNMPRYKVRFLESQEQVIETVKSQTNKGKKILWVVNTVERCQELAQQMQIENKCYHSQFKLEDRKDRHREVIAAFQQRGKPVLIITTQVCEMSLDISSDVLISEIAPITSIIQRMGRNNRSARPRDGVLGEVYIYAASSITPYSQEDLAGAEEFISELVKAEAVSQTMLQELLEKYGPKERTKNPYTAFLENGPWATKEGSIRQTKDYKVPAILDTDIARYRKLLESGKAFDGLLVPVPQRFAANRLGRYPRVAPGNHYSKEFGFLNRPLEVKHE
ncbi:CRISPR-associated helicase Cas3' [Desulforamulus ferrireducens]|uniref:CRISPR-associated helicase Cas3 n=1 Tax=Desulforamulus ferrireducens TaxID=1833852 RepID=A0A1S6IZK4_9FIRM|nr:CRISPR-associated helicase Cas3' [Desulforamulus ferrireducens]AQS60189.1 CRISPR-associated helicase Cas3' [Desulforamulus ferrireducens]